MRLPIRALAVALVLLPQSVRAQQPALKEVFRRDFLIGAAINADQFSGRDARAVAITKKHFNTISPENTLKWESVHPRLGVYEFADADRYVDFGTANKMFVIGHTLVWHSQIGRWVFQDSAGIA